MKYKSLFLIITLSSFFSIQCFSFDKNEISPYLFKKNIQNFFLNKHSFPLESFIHSGLIFSNDSMEQYNSIMDFPPFQDYIDRGEKLFYKKIFNNKSLSSCLKIEENKDFKYPKFDTEKLKIITLERQINLCLTELNHKKWKHNDPFTMGSVMAFIKSKNKGKTLIVDLPDIALDNFNNGKELYFKRIGKMNLACSSCHLLNSGKFFRDEQLSPTIGQPNHYPIFRKAEQYYSIQMRYQLCMKSVGAEPYELNSKELNQLEFFHSFISSGIPIDGGVYRR